MNSHTKLWTRRQYVRECYKIIQSCKRTLGKTTCTADRRLLGAMIKNLSADIGLDATGS